MDTVSRIRIPSSLEVHTSSFGLPFSLPRKALPTASLVRAYHPRLAFFPSSAAAVSALASAVGIGFAALGELAPSASRVLDKLCAELCVSDGASTCSAWVREASSGLAVGGSVDVGRTLAPDSAPEEPSGAFPSSTTVVLVSAVGFAATFLVFFFVAYVHRAGTGWAQGAHRARTGRAQGGHRVGTCDEGDSALACGSVGWHAVRG